MSGYHKYIFFIIICCYSTVLCAQDKVQVVVKTIHKEFDFKPGKQLILVGEKSQIQIAGWDKNKISVELKLISKHADKEIALHDLEYSQYILKEEQGSYIIRNFFSTTEQYTSINSNLNVQYVIHVPLACILDIKNTYGSIAVNNLHADINLVSTLAPITLSHIIGNINLNSKYGDIIVESAKGSLTIRADKSNLTVNRQDGICNIENKYGKVDLIIGELAGRMKINSKFSTINVFVKDFKSQGYKFNTTAGEIYLPEQYKNDIIRKTTKRSFNYDAESKSQIVIESILTLIHVNVVN